MSAFNNTYWSVSVDDVQNHNLSNSLQEKLLDIFEQEVKMLSGTIINHVSYNLGDYQRAKVLGIDGIQLVLERTLFKGKQRQWTGTFLRNEDARTLQYSMLVYGTADKCRR